MERLHDKANRRLVNISITAEGKELLERLKNDMLQTTLQSFSDLTDPEIQQLQKTLADAEPLIRKMICTTGASSGRSLCETEKYPDPSAL